MIIKQKYVKYNMHFYILLFGEFVLH